MVPSVSIDDGIVFRRNPDAAFRTYDGEGVVLMPSGTEVHVLNEVGARVWDLIDGRRDVAALIEAVRGEFEVEADQAARDVREFLDSLRDKDMITPAG